MTVTAKWYTEKYLPEKFDRVPNKEIRLHYNNASSFTAALTLQFLAGKNIKVIEHPPYSPDLAMCDFRLFFELKRNLRLKRFSSEEECVVAVHVYFEGIPKRDWLGAFKQ